MTWTNAGESGKHLRRRTNQEREGQAAGEEGDAQDAERTVKDETGNTRRCSHGTICRGGELGDDDGDDGDRAEQLAEEDGVKQAFLLYFAPAEVDRGHAKVAEKDGQEAAGDEEEDAVGGEVAAEGRGEEGAVGEGIVDGAEGVGVGVGIKCGKVGDGEGGGEMDDDGGWLGRACAGGDGGGDKRHGWPASCIRP